MLMAVQNTWSMGFKKMRFEGKHFVLYFERVQVLGFVCIDSCVTFVINVFFSICNQCKRDG